MLRVLYFGLPLAACCLARDGHYVALAILSPVTAPGRRRVRRILGEARVIDTFDVSADTIERAVDRVLDDGVDLVVSWYWTRRLPAPWLDRARLGGLGAHPSLLPRHRGPNPFYAAIDDGDSMTGVSIHRLEAEYDTGDVLASSTVEVGDRNAWQLARALDRPGIALLREVVTRLASGASCESTRQDPRLATWAPEPTGPALRVNWTWSTSRVLRRIRALSPVPGLAIETMGVRAFVTAAQDATDYPRVLAPGEAGLARGRVVVRTADGAIAIERAVLESGAEVSGAAFAAATTRARATSA